MSSLTVSKISAI